MFHDVFIVLSLVVTGIGGTTERTPLALDAVTADAAVQRSPSAQVEAPEGTSLPPRVERVATARTPATARLKPVTKPAPVACPVDIDERGVVRVAGRATKLRYPAPEDRIWGGPEIAVWPLDDNTVLATLAANWSHGAWNEPELDGKLWAIDCSSRAVEVYFEQARADFGNAALTEDGSELFYTGADGVFTLHLARRATRRVTQAPTRECYGPPTESEPPLQLRDVVVGFTAGERRLIVHRGGLCQGGCNSAWTGHTVHVLRPRGERTPRVHIPHAVATVVADAAGELWLGDGFHCAEPGPCHRGTGGALWHSSDGEAWTRVAVGAGEERPYRAIAHVLTDAKRPGHLVVLEASIANDAAGEVPGQLFASEDAGRTWRRVEAPGGLNGAAGFEAVELVDGHTETLRVRIDGESLDEGEARSWVTNDGGRSWTADAGPVEPAPALALVVGDKRFRATLDGLWRRTPGHDDAVRVFP